VENIVHNSPFILLNLHCKCQLILQFVQDHQVPPSPR
jgi:hypothetical protein